MSGKFATVDALTEFLRATPESPENVLETLGMALAKAGEEGLSLASLMEASGLDRAHFLPMLVDGIKAGLFEKNDEDGRIHLTAEGMDIY